MPYTPQTWSDLPSQTTPITAARLSHIETQYDQVAGDIDDPATPVGAAVAANADAYVSAQVTSGPLTGAALDGLYGPSSIDAARYVSTGGNDANDGFSWNTAKATIQAAIDALPGNGGVVEVGYGEFAGFTIQPVDTASTPNWVHIRGRGVGHDQSAGTSETSVPSPGRHATRITSPCVIDGALPGTLTSDATANWIPFILEDLAITGVTGDGLTIQTPLAWLRNISVSSNTGRGIVVGPGWSWFFRMDNVRVVSNGSYGFYGDKLQTLSATNCQFDGNGNHGFYTPIANSEDIAFYNCWFQRNQGAGFYGFAYTAAFFSCHWDGNVHISKAQAEFPNGGSITMFGCQFRTGNTTDYAIDTSANGSIVALGCHFAAHGRGAIKARPNDSAQNPAGFRGLLAGNKSEGVFVYGSTYPSIPAGAAQGVILGAGTSGSVTVDHSVSVDGAITLDASRASEYTVNLSANVTGTTISNPSPGQTLILTFAQDAAGGRTYTWPTDCRFAGGTAPSDTTANRLTSVTFRRNDSLWIEVSRAVAVG